MVISVNTVKTHMRKVLAKFGVHSKAELRVALGSWDFAPWVANQEMSHLPSLVLTRPNTLDEGTS